jgi:hypothetical protein
MTSLPRILLRKARTLAAQPAFVWLWLAPTWLLLGLSRATILVVPFRRLAPRIGVLTGVEPWIPLISEAQRVRAVQIARTVNTAARYTPWESNCFPQAVTARILLGLYRIPYALYFGLAKGPGHAETKAHAWVAAGPVRVTGGLSFPRFTVVGCFVAPPLARSWRPLGSGGAS